MSLAPSACVIVAVAANVPAAAHAAAERAVVVFDFELIDTSLDGDMSIYVRDVTSGRVIAAMNADTRGNTHESWSRTLDWLVRNRLRQGLDGVRE